ncbi:MAG TPA: hypothetical protein ENK08_09370 [Chloroflexi bacterium]|nr:hypothetical protein [Chloroflexota bacterium]
MPVSIQTDNLAPPLTPEATAYAWEQVLQRAGFEPDIPLWYGDPTRAPTDFGGVVVTPCALDAFESLLHRPSGSLQILPLSRVLPPGVPSPLTDPLPVLFWGAGCEDGGLPFAERHPDGLLVFHADIIAATFFMLSRWEETVVAVRDEHDRFPATASVAYKQGFLDRPIVDEYALVLRAWLMALLPRHRPRRHRFRVHLGSDVDHVRPFPTWGQGIRVLGGDLFKRRSLWRAWGTARELVMQAFRPAQTSEIRGIEYLAQLAAHYGLDAAFYFKASDPSPFDSGYDPASPLVRRLIERLRQRGFEIGLHAGYYTLNDPARLRDEKARLDAVLGTDKYGGRQHYLRFRVPGTWRDGERVGLTYDATMGYADHEGFRCGTCHPFHPFDCLQNRVLNIVERPLIVMDATLKGYRRMSPAEGKERILSLARRCRQVEGVFSLVWHPTLLREIERPWARICQEVLAELSRLQRESI